MNDKAAEIYVKRFLKMQLKKKGVTYRYLADELNKKGFNVTMESIACKLSRGNFKASFFVAVMCVLGIKKIVLEEL